MNHNIRNANESFGVVIIAFLLAQLIWGANIKEIVWFASGAICVWAMMIWYIFVERIGK